MTLESMGAWDIVEQDENMNAIQLIWASKCNHYPDGIDRKFKYRFCARVDQQLEVIKFFETYAPVVQCTTVF